MSNTFQSLNGLFKEVYADKIQSLVPENLKLMKMVPFAAQEKSLGNLFHQPVIVGSEHGLSWGASDADAFSLQAPISGQIKDAQVRGNPKVLRSVLGYSAASRAAQGTQAAFMNGTKFLVANMLRSMSKKLEIEMLYGQSGYGTVGSTSGNTVTITPAEWAPGIWVGSEGMPVQVRNPAGSVLRGSATIVSVNLDTRTLTLDVLPAGTLANDVLWHAGSYGADFAGLHKIVTNTGTLFGIDASQFSVWRGNTYDAGGTSLSLGKIEFAISRAVAKGLESDSVCLVSPLTWSDLLVEQSALRRYDSSYSSDKKENGARQITFFGTNGMITIEPSIYVKQGFAYIVQPDSFMRIGSSDITFNRPGMGNDSQYFRELESSAGFELRCWTDQALFCSHIGRQTIITNIVNSQ
jgi:hypothetical protein